MHELNVSTMSALEIMKAVFIRGAESATLSPADRRLEEDRMIIDLKEATCFTDETLKHTHTTTECILSCQDIMMHAVEQIMLEVQTGTLQGTLDPEDICSVMDEDTVHRRVLLTLFTSPVDACVPVCDSKPKYRYDTTFKRAILATPTSI